VSTYCNEVSDTVRSQIHVCVLPSLLPHHLHPHGSLPWPVQLHQQHALPRSPDVVCATHARKAETVWVVEVGA